MATAKPKVKRMMLGGTARSAAPMRTQSQMQNAARSAAAQAAPKPVPNYAKPYTSAKQVPDYAKPYLSAAQVKNAMPRGALGGNRPPAGANLMQAYGPLKPAMKKGGTVKKKAVKK